MKDRDVHKTVFTSRHQTVEIADTPFARGGEGTVHKILAPSTLQFFCVKLYYERYRTEQRREKIEFMVNNPPSGLSSSVYMVCWPSELVFEAERPEEQKFIGFLMPMAWLNNVPLYAVCLLRPAKTSPPWLAEKFARNTPAGQELRLKLMVNIASAVHRIHRLNQYVLVDMKPQNILITPEAKIAMVDLDSIQISDKGRVLFRAQVATDEYTPPEASAIDLNGDCVPVHWDRFSIAVIFYQLLFGVHPFSASFKDAYADVTTPKQAIKQGLFVHGPKRCHIYTLPSPHQAFDTLDVKLKALFKRAFEIGLRHPPRLRPSAEDWGKTIYGVLIPAEPFSLARTLGALALTALMVLADGGLAHWLGRGVIPVALEGGQRESGNRKQAKGKNLEKPIEKTGKLQAHKKKAPANNKPK